MLKPRARADQKQLAWPSKNNGHRSIVKCKRQCFKQESEREKEEEEEEREREKEKKTETSAHQHLCSSFNALTTQERQSCTT